MKSIAESADTRVLIEAADACAAAREGILEVPGQLQLHHGGSLEGVRLAWRLTGPAGAHVVAALGGISAHRVVYSEGQARHGWWDGLVGPGRALDASRFRILGIDYLGGSGATSGPRDGESFPSLSSYDQAELLLRLVNHLGLTRLHAIVGASYGGMVALAFAERFADRVERLLVIGASDTTHPMATAWRSVQRRLVRYALTHGEGARGLELARALAMATYRSPEEFAARFRAAPEPTRDGFEFAVERYLFARGADYANQYRAQSFLCLSESIDLHSVDATRIHVPVTVVGVREDQLVPLSDLRALCARLQPHARLIEISSIYGHDAFLKEAGRLEPVFRNCLETAHE
ncbi:MAG TPA: homoserine O-succinyltransferase [Steroidobacteraceae bacterium]|nr:homoserine O-succinyltransferase [Steroidobacteraceae bacterium]